MGYNATLIDEAADNTDHSFSWDMLKYGEPQTLVVYGDSVLLEHVADFGGEGEGEHAHVVFKIGEQLFKKDAYYASHDGYYWDGELSEVRPTQKTITVYESI